MAGSLCIGPIAECVHAKTGISRPFRSGSVRFGVYNDPTFGGTVHVLPTSSTDRSWNRQLTDGTSDKTKCDRNDDENDIPLEVRSPQQLGAEKQKDYGFKR